MSAELKKEFEEFVASLSKEICENILIDDMKKINTDFRMYSKEHLAQLKEFKFIERKLGGQIKQLDNLSVVLDEYNKLTDKNTQKVERALAIVDNDYKKVLNTIIKRNEKLLNLYKNEITIFNNEQREVYISDMQETFDKSILKLSNEVNDKYRISEIENIKEIIMMQDHFIVSMKEELDKVFQIVSDNKLEENYKGLYKESISFYNKESREVEVIKKEIMGIKKLVARLSIVVVILLIIIIILVLGF